MLPARAERDSLDVLRDLRAHEPRVFVENDSEVGQGFLHEAPRVAELDRDSWLCFRLQLSADVNNFFFESREVARERARVSVAQRPGQVCDLPLKTNLAPLQLVVRHDELLRGLAKFFLESPEGVAHNL